MTPDGPACLAQDVGCYVILPIMVLRRLDAVLGATKPNVLSMKLNLDDAAITNQDAALRLGM